MRPKGKLLALFAVFAAIGLVTASGAFTTVAADRTVNVNVAGDGAALLQLQGNNTNPGGNGQYVNKNNGQIEIAIDGSNLNNANGVNQNATTDIDYMITVTNNGGQSVEFNTSDASNLDFYLNGTPSTSVQTAGKSKTIGSGQSIDIGLSVTTDDSGSYNLNQTVTFTADAEA